MGSTRVVVGTDERGRPRSEWRTTPGDDGEPHYGFMEPAHTSPIERRQATPDELAAARAREAEPSHLVAPTGSAGVIVQRAPSLPPVEVPAEEPPVSEPPPNIPETIPPADGTPLDRLVQAAAQAAETHERKQAADTAWEIARDALAAAYAEVQGIVEPMPHKYESLVPFGATAGEWPAEVSELGAVAPPVRTRTGEGQRPGQQSARDRRALAVMAAMQRHDDDMGAAAAELGMKKNAVAQIVKHARLRVEAAQA